MTDATQQDGKDQEATTQSTIDEVSCCVHPLMPEILEELNCSLIMTSYQAGKLITVRSLNKQLDVHLIECPRPMGLAVDEQRMTLGIWSQILDYRRDHKVSLDGLENVTACFAPRASHVTGMINVHDIAWGDGQLWMVNSNFSCLSSMDGHHGFVPRWKPPFISDLVPEDRCHLNGMAMRDERPRYVTTFSKFDDKNSWRETTEFDGTLIDVVTNKILADGLVMPHSPRYHQGTLYFCESGLGRIWQMNPETGEKSILTELPGFTRGVSFYGSLMFVGLSKVRASTVRKSPPLADRAEETQCGLWVIDLNTGNTLANLSFERGIEQIYDVATVMNSHFPQVLEWRDETMQRLYHYPDLVPL